MNNLVIILATVCVILSLAFAIYNYICTKSTFDKINQMIDDAMDGTFTEVKMSEIAMVWELDYILQGRLWLVKAVI